MRLGKKLPFDLRGAQRDIARDKSGLGVADDAGTRNSRGVIVPGMPAEPSVQGVPSAVERTAVVVLGERTGRSYFRHVGGRPASSSSPATSRAGAAAQASKRSQS